jgi:SAM-dependent methyltransferase
MNASTNDDVYAGGLLTRALDPSSQPPEIQTFLREEIGLIRRLVAGSKRVIDIGCGTGRHLALLESRLALGVGVDYQPAYVAEAFRRRQSPHLHFVVADAAAVPIATNFDSAICLTSSWGTMTDKLAVLAEMRRLSPRPQTRFITVYSRSSIDARREWYARLGLDVVEVTPEYLLTDGGFRSEHFTEQRLQHLVGDCVIRPITEMAYLVMA